MNLPSKDVLVEAITTESTLSSICENGSANPETLMPDVLFVTLSFDEIPVSELVIKSMLEGAIGF